MTAFKQPIDQLDQQILRALVKDAKTPYTEIAKQSGVSAATIHVRVEKIRQKHLSQCRIRFCGGLHRKNIVQSISF